MAPVPCPPRRAIATFADVAGVGAEREAQRCAPIETARQGQRSGAFRNDPLTTQGGE